MVHCCCFFSVVFVVCCHGNPGDEPSLVSFVLDFMLSKGALVSVHIFLDLMSLNCTGGLSLIFLFEAFLRYCRDQNSCGALSEVVPGLRLRVFGGLPLGLLQSTRRYEMQRNGAYFTFTLRLLCGRLRAVCCKDQLRSCNIEKTDFPKLCQNKGLGELVLKI